MWTEETAKRLEEVLTPEMGFPLQADIRAALEEIKRLRADLADCMNAKAETWHELDVAKAREAKLREWLNDALAVLEAPAGSSNDAKRELARKMRAALADEVDRR